MMLRWTVALCLLVLSVVGCSGTPSARTPREGSHLITIGGDREWGYIPGAARMRHRYAIPGDQGLVDSSYLPRINGSRLWLIRDRRLEVVDLLTGHTVWRSRTEVGVDSMAAGFAQRLYLLDSNTGELRAYEEKDGSIAWSRAVEGLSSTARLFASQHRVVLTDRRRVEVRDTANGDLAWEKVYETHIMDPMLQERQLTGLFLESDVLFVRMESKDFNPPVQTWAFDVLAGHRKWYAIGEPLHATREEVYFFSPRYNDVVVRDLARGEFVKNLTLERFDGRLLRAEGGQIIFTSGQKWVDPLHARVGLDGSVERVEPGSAPYPSVLSVSRTTGVILWHVEFNVGNGEALNLFDGDDGILAVRVIPRKKSRPPTWIQILDTRNGNEEFQLLPDREPVRILAASRFVGLIHSDGMIDVIELLR